jgi:hypothetical protein
MRVRATFSFVAVAALAVGLVACEKKPEVEPSRPQAVAQRQVAQR